jgi:hypothetical protein
LLRELHQHKVDYILVGGMALNFQGLARATRDVDIFVRPTLDNIDRLKRAMAAVWDDPSILDIDADELMGDYPAVCYGPPEDEGFSVDILTRLGEAFSFADLEAETKMVDGFPIQVATPATLYRMKCDTVRPQEKIDALVLRERFKLEDP